MRSQCLALRLPTLARSIHDPRTAGAKGCPGPGGPTFTAQESPLLFRAGTAMTRARAAIGT
ncbi:hypothetical protein [Streptomyces sp. AK02-01A]|uniref:hypothetical protein n=1 Tax=Streptomyces sp. AK02-01A TaxID=3028648 RepID=UPI0029A37D30|nr:hypothetical protein [Streptomyces sp. AK02-01A]MDX3855603.1 hypothetical protein [Streptomyces sp. AK02-01A]